jgi:hypothetical protein
VSQRNNNTTHCHIVRGFVSVFLPARGRLFIVCILLSPTIALSLLPCLHNHLLNRSLTMYKIWRENPDFSYLGTPTLLLLETVSSSAVFRNAPLACPSRIPSFNPFDFYFICIYRRGYSRAGGRQQQRKLRERRPPKVPGGGPPRVSLFFSFFSATCLQKPLSFAF